MFPLLLLLRQESNEPGILPQIIQVRVAFKQRIAGKAIVGRRLQPFDRLLRFVHQRIGARNIIGRVMKVPESLSLFNRCFDFFLGDLLLPG